MARPSTPILKRRIRTGIKRFKNEWNQVAFDPTSFSQKFISQKIRRFGKQFIGKFSPLEFDFNHELFKVSLDFTKFESPIGVVLSWQDAVQGWNCPLGYVKLGFDHDAVCIEAVQGEKGYVKPLKHFEKAVGMPWPNFLIKKIEANARRVGYKQVRFRDVGSMFYYQKPDITERVIKEYRAQHVEAKGLDDSKVEALVEQQIRTRMRTLYSKLYSALGYHQHKGEYWIKDL